ncbi:MAG: micrococcal nuclease [Solirubrobacteraceae bacterium]|jgi:micrococcal nuclease|nr:micrococcal nuclease [Solirubrobacteraceae bacterium]
MWIVVVVALAAGAGVRPPGGGKDDLGSGKGADGRVVRVVDGDTIKVRLAARTETVRYIGVDTPETVKPGTPVQCYGHAASAANRRLVGGREVELRVGAEPRDRYGRLLAYVYRASDHLFVNADLVRRGYARTLTIPPNDALAPRFAVLQRQASAGGRGLWSACAP